MTMILSDLRKKAGSMLNRSRTVSTLVALLGFGPMLMLGAPTSWAADAVSAPAANVDSRMEDAKSELLRLNRDLLALEEELLAPAGTQVAVFLSVQGGQQLDLDSVQVLIDGKVVANQLYSERDVHALLLGGVQRVYVGSLRTGEHTLVAFFTGKGNRARDNKRGATFKFTKTSTAKLLELQVKDSSAKNEPDFGVKVWQ
jgi:hypothetical protein